MSFTEPLKAKTFLAGHFSGTRVTHALELVYQYHNGVRKDGVTPEWFHQLSILMYLMTMESSFEGRKIFSKPDPRWPEWQSVQSPAFGCVAAIAE